MLLKPIPIPLAQAGKRLVVLGTTGSGKTTMARRLAAALNVPHVELDALNWESDWREAPLPEFRRRVQAAVAGEAWVVDGNYSKARDVVWKRAETLVWLDFPLYVVIWRLLLRTLRRVLSKQELWGGNKESFRKAFFSKDSLFIWALRTHWRRRRRFRAEFGLPEYAHLEIVRLTSPVAADRWLEDAEVALQQAE